MSIELLRGDCLEVMKTLPDKSVDLFLCDLPYGCLTTPGGGLKDRKNGDGGFITGCPWDVKINLDLFWEQVRRLAKNDNTPIIHFCTTRFGFDLYNSNPKWFRYELVWDKMNGVSFLSANKMPLRCHEMIYIFSKSGAYYNRIDYDDPDKTQINRDISKHKKTRFLALPNLKVSKGAPTGKRCVVSVIPCAKYASHKQSHPTEKPLELYKWLIERYCPAGGTVLDPTAGSGNVGFACWDLDRNCILIEKDEKFHKAISDKLDTLSH